jgi:hypothetical protein
MEGKSMLTKRGATSARSMMESLALHVFVLALLMLVPAQMIRSAPPDKRTVDVVFHKAPARPVPPTVALAAPKATNAGVCRQELPAPALKPRPDLPPGPDGPGKPELPRGPEESIAAPEQIREKVGKVGILALKDKFASLSREDKLAPRLGADARYSAAEDVGKSSSRLRVGDQFAGIKRWYQWRFAESQCWRRWWRGGGGGTGGGGRGGSGAGGFGGSGGMPVARATSISLQSAATTGPRHAVDRGLRARMKKYKSCSIDTKRRSTGSTTVSCATTRRCRDRWCCD